MDYRTKGKYAFISRSAKETAGSFGERIANLDAEVAIDPGDRTAQRTLAVMQAKADTSQASSAARGAHAVDSPELEGLIPWRTSTQAKTGCHGTSRSCDQNTV
jgi:hypothetical protein